MSSIRCALMVFIFLLVPSLALAQEARTFDLKLEEGKKFYSKTSTTVSQKIKVMGQDLDQFQESTFFFAWTPTKQKVKPIGAVSPDGTSCSLDLESGAEEMWQLICEIEGIKMKIHISGNKIEYDSAVPDDSSTANPVLTEFFKKMVGAKFTVTLNKNYRVEKVDGVNELLSRLAPANSGMDELLKQIMSDDAVKQLFDPTFGLLPESPKRPGEKWTTTRTLHLGPMGSYTITYHSTYIGIVNNMDMIEIVPQVTYMAPKQKDVDKSLLKVKEGKLTSESNAKGIVFYDPWRRRIDSGNISMTLKGDLTVTIGMADTKVELVQTQKTIIKISDHSLLSSKSEVETPETPVPAEMKTGPAPVLVCQPMTCCEPTRHPCLRSHRIFGRRLAGCGW